MSDRPLADVVNSQWDAIVIGTGVGGATLGYALAKAGKKVLFCEKGVAHSMTPDALRGAYAENFFAQPAVPRREHREILMRAGRYADPIADDSGPRMREFIPFIGAGTGGSSALYGMALERFFPQDFRPREKHPGAPDSSLPENWPVSYDALVPYYQSAEQLYRIRGTADPLRGDPQSPRLLPPPDLTPGGREIFDFLKARGLHPYRVPLACEHVTGCECCQGYLCAKNCKNDSGRICLGPALREHGAELLDRCEVLRLEASAEEVTGVVCSRAGEQFTLRAPLIILAAGALETPAILLKSTSECWPQGLANGSGMVGRNLMRHHVDLYLITPRTPGPLDNRQKELAFNDFYAPQEGAAAGKATGRRLGSVQSFGRLPAAAILAESLEQDIRDGSLPWAAGLFKLVKPVLRSTLEKLVDRSLVLATIMEDLPYEDNRVVPTDRASTAPLTMRYKVRAYDQERTDAFRAAMQALLKPYKAKLIKQAENNQRIAHVCGTCRFGDDPATSVLDANNRAHGLNNLFIVDSSFFPSSGGTNPSLTIAANALRVADHLIGEFERPDDRQQG